MSLFKYFLSLSGTKDRIDKYLRIQDPILDILKAKLQEQLSRKQRL